MTLGSLHTEEMGNGLHDITVKDALLFEVSLCVFLAYVYMYMCVCACVCVCVCLNVCISIYHTSVGSVPNMSSSVCTDIASRPQTAPLHFHEATLTHVWAYKTLRAEQNPFL